MSQAKVDKHKEEKANRKKIMKKEKIMHMVRRTVIGVISLALVGWLGYSAYNIYESKKPVETAEIDYTAITDYESNLMTAE